MTIGDVLAAIAAVGVLGATWAAVLLLVALAFPARAGRAQEALVSSPGAALARGAGVALLLGLVGVMAISHPAGPGRLVAALCGAAAGALAALGSAGIVRLVGERIQAVGTPMSPFASLTRGAALYVLAGFLPILGWFLIAPLALLLSLGSAVVALRRVRPVATGRQASLVTGRETAEVSA